MAKTNELFAEAEETAEVLEEPLAHTMLRTVANTFPPLGDAQTVQQVDADVSAWIAKGYHLVNSHYIGMETNGIVMVYVLAKSPA